jgi:tocopherol O-methyltransferase
MHHGHYGPDGRQKKDHRQAQVDLIETLLRWAGVAAPARVLDLGCGIGGSALYFAEKYGSRVEGITLSPVQARRAGERAAARGLAGRASFAVADGQRLPFADASFDLVWALESAEHIPDRKRLVSECARVLRPGGALVVATWCRRGQPPPSRRGRTLLRAIRWAYELPEWVPSRRYQEVAVRAGLEAVRGEDWSRSVAPFWGAVLRRSLTLTGLFGVLRAGWVTIRGAGAILAMMQAYRSQVIEYAVLTARKPAHA